MGATHTCVFVLKICADVKYLQKEQIKDNIQYALLMNISLQSLLHCFNALTTETEEISREMEESQEEWRGCEC